MLPEIKLTISQNDKIIQAVSKPMEKEHIIRSLEEFQLEANAALTKMIEDLGDISDAGGDCNMDEDEEEDDDKLMPPSKEQKEQSECKKKKK